MSNSTIERLEAVMTKEEQDDYLVAHFGIDLSQVEISKATGIPYGSLWGRIKQLKNTGRIPQDRTGYSYYGIDKQPDGTPAEVKHSCPPHHRICGDNDILAMWPDFYQKHERPALGVEVQVCKYCGDIKAVETYKPNGTDAQIERNLASMRESRVIAEAREREYAEQAGRTVPGRTNGNGASIHRPAEPQETVPYSLVDKLLEFEYDGDSGDKRHDPPAQLHHLEIPEEQAVPLLAAGELEMEATVATGADLFEESRPLPEEPEVMSPSHSMLTIAHQELLDAKVEIALLKEELQDAYGQNRVLSARLQKTVSELHWASKLLLYGELVAKRDDLQRQLAELGEQILGLGEEIRQGQPAVEANAA